MSKSLIAGAIALCLIACTTTTPSNAADTVTTKGTTVQITFSSVNPEVGKIWVGVCTKQELARRYRDVNSRCSAEQWLDAAEGATVSFDALNAGTYAITAFHDENDNLEMDFDTRGMPFEATGNGNNVKGRFGPPTFKDMKFVLPAAGTEQAPLTFTVNFYRVGE